MTNPYAPSTMQARRDFATLAWVRRFLALNACLFAIPVLLLAIGYAIEWLEFALLPSSAGGDPVAYQHVYHQKGSIDLSLIAMAVAIPNAVLLCAFLLSCLSHRKQIPSASEGQHGG